MLEWLERRFKSAYLRLLESEVVRLREENRQLVNSLLVSHGMPGISAPTLPQDMRPVKRQNWSDYKRKMERLAARPPVGPPQPAPETGGPDAQRNSPV